MKILFEGFYGFKNTGDDAFVEVSSWGSEKYWNCKNNVFLGESIPETVHKINTRQILSHIRGFDRLNFLAHLTNADYLISSGGSTFSELPFHSNKTLSRHYKKIRKDLKLGAIGVSIGPFKNSQAEKVVKLHLESLNFLSVRDSRSFHYVNSLTLPYKPINSFDLAALLPLVYNNSIATESNQEIIGISICNHERYNNGDLSKEKRRNLFFRELIELVEKNTNVHFKVFIINGHKIIGDEEVTKQLISNIDKNRISIVPYLNNVSETWKEINKCKLIISTRLHASIFACYANIPFFLIEYHKKCTDFVLDVGQDETYRLYDAEVSPKYAFEKINEILNGNYIKPKYVNKTIELSKKNFTAHNIT